MGKITTDDVDLIEWTISTDCAFCGRLFEENVDKFEYDSMDEGAAAVLTEAGWEISEDDEQVGIACPSCTETLQEEE